MSNANNRAYSEKEFERLMAKEPTVNFFGVPVFALDFDDERFENRLNDLSNDSDDTEFDGVGLA